MSFYARCYSAYMLSPVRPTVRLSVCPSVRQVDHTKTVEDTIMKFSPYGSTIPLVFSRASFISKFWGAPPERGR